ncbi:MAG: cation:proton antiporter [Thermoleophilaceae bacterium]|nr:cation:proton antiporter [Thermoleophilaceae bacterium]
MIDVDTESFLVIVVAGAVAALAAGFIAPRLTLPVVVLEIVVGPELLDLVRPDEFIEFFSSLGLGMLFCFAGYEIDFDRIRGTRSSWPLVGAAILSTTIFPPVGLRLRAGQA